MKKSTASILKENVQLDIRGIGSVPADQAAEMMSLSFSMGQLRMLKKIELYGNDNPLPVESLTAVVEMLSDEQKEQLKSHLEAINTWISNDDSKT